MKSSTASSLPPLVERRSIDANDLAEKIFNAINQKIIFGLRLGNTFSIRRILFFSGQGKLGYLSTNACAVII